MENDQTLNVLMLEDNRDDAELVARRLQRAGFLLSWQRVETEQTYLEHLHPDLDLILADFTLPQFNTIKALTQLQERELDVPFIIVSGTIGEEAAVEAMRRGATDYLLKDRLSRLPDAVRRALKERELRRERKQAQEELRQTKERYQRLVEFSPEPIAVHAEGKFVYVNPATVELLGAEDAEELLGRPVLDVVHHETRDLAIARIQRMMQTGEPEPPAEEKIVRLDGAVIHVEITATPITYRGQPAIQIIGRDVTERKRLRQAYQKLVEESLQGIVIIQDRRFVFCNQAYADIVGYPVHELLSLSAEEAVALIHPDDRRRVLQYNRRRMTDNSAPTRYEYRIVRKDGGLRWLEASVTQTTYEGRPAAQAYYVDITERKRTEEAERQQRVYAEALADTASVLNSSLEPDTVLDRILANIGRVVPHDAGDVSLLVDGVAQTERYHGYSEVGLGTVIENVALPLSETPTLQEMVRTGRPLITPDIPQSDLWVEPYLAPLRAALGVPIRIEGEVAGFIHLFSLTPGAFSQADAARSQAFADQVAIALRNARLYQRLERHSETLEKMVTMRTAELQRTKERVEAILDSVGEGILLLDADGNIMEANPAVETQTGYERQDLHGRHSRELLPDTELTADAYDEILSAVLEGEAWHAETTIRRRNGTTYDAALTIMPMRESETDGGVFVVSIRDITRMKEVERMKDSILAIAAHELRTPLTTLGLLSDLLLNRPPPEEERRRRVLETVDRQVTQLQKIVDDMLDLARLEAGRGLEIVPEPIDVWELAEEVVQPFAATAEEHTFRLERPRATKAVNADPARLKQVLRNLLSNAVKYSPRGGPVTVRGRERRGCVEVSVQDEGIGMTPEQQQNLFQKFYRAQTGDRAPKGAGLGLAICKLIVEKHGGRIWVESEKGVGTTFAFTIPIAGRQD